jgi:DnaK suppressor protein
MGKNKLDFFKEMLVRQLNTVCCAIEHKRAQSRREVITPEADPLDFCVQSFSREQIYLICEMDRQTLALVREAMARIQSNSYGLCEECQGPIGDKRLKALPWNKLCIQCQGARESATAS